MDDEREARRGLMCVSEAGDPAMARLVERVGALEAWEMVRASTLDSAWTRRARVWDADAVLQGEQSADMRFLVPGDPEWPEGLEGLASTGEVGGMVGPALGLWVRGASLGATLRRSVALVGSRAATPYGERVASDFAEGLVGRGYCIVSGAAYGIDAAAHRGALAEGGQTVAFLACGVDEPYPRANAALIERILDTGALASEYPPGEHPTRPRFLARNRLIAAASLGVVIVEAAFRSGARNTGSWATACGRPLMAVPGPITSGMTETPHRLIRNAEAVLVTSVDDIVEEIAPLGTVDQVRPRREHLLDGLSPQARAVYEALPSRGARTTGDLAMRSGLSVPETLAAVGELEDEGFARRRPQGWGLGDRSDRPMLPSEHRDDRSREACAP